MKLKLLLILFNYIHLSRYKFIQDFLEKSSKPGRFGVTKLEDVQIVMDTSEEEKSIKDYNNDLERLKDYPTYADMVLNFIPGQRGKSLLYFNGFTFAKNNECGGAVYWCCRSRKAGKPACRARITTNKQENGLYKIVVTKPHHNHNPSVRMLKKIEKCIKPDTYMSD